MDINLQEFFSLQPSEEQIDKPELLFEDLFFPADDSMLIDSHKGMKVQWLRPWEITRNWNFSHPEELRKNPWFILNGVKTGDINQGKCGDCWMISAFISLTKLGEVFDQYLIQYLIDESTGQAKTYDGSFEFKFHKGSKEYCVKIDDRLPYLTDKLLYAHSKDSSEYWASILEKAYVKCFGSRGYAGVQGNWSCRAVAQMIGYPIRFVDMISLNDERLQQLFLKTDRRDGLIAMSIRGKENVIEEKREDGLVEGHAYSVDNVGVIDDKLTCLCRINNPWGAWEWKGAWSDEKPEWSQFGEVFKKNFGYKQGDDGSFHMCIQDVRRCFHIIEINLKAHEQCIRKNLALDASSDRTNCKYMYFDLKKEKKIQLSVTQFHPDDPYIMNKNADSIMMDWRLFKGTRQRRKQILSGSLGKNGETFAQTWITKILQPGTYFIECIPDTKSYVYIDVAVEVVSDQTPTQYLEEKKEIILELIPVTDINTDIDHLCVIHKEVTRIYNSIKSFRTIQHDDEFNRALQYYLDDGTIELREFTILYKKILFLDYIIEGIFDCKLDPDNIIKNLEYYGITFSKSIREFFRNILVTHMHVLTHVNLMALVMKLMKLIYTYEKLPKSPKQSKEMNLDKHIIDTLAF